MATPATILRSILIDLGLVQLPAELAVPGFTPLSSAGLNLQDSLPLCFVGSLPNDPDRVVVMRDGGGLPGGREMNGGRRRAQPAVKFVVRDVAYDKAYTLANQIADALDEQIDMISTTVPEDQTVHYVAAVKRTTAVTDMGEEVGTKRNLFSIDCRITFQDQEPSIG